MDNLSEDQKSAYKFGMFVKHLHRETEKKEITWKCTEQRGVFEGFAEPYIIRIAVGQKALAENFTRTDYILSIIDDNGNIIDTQSGLDIQMCLAFTDHAMEDWYGYVKSFYKTVRSIAIGIKSTEAIDQIIGNLERKSNNRKS